MKKLLALCAALFLALAAATTFAQAAAPADVTGTWSGSMNAGGNDMTITFHLKQDGAKLTGNVETGMGDPVEIVNGKVDGAKVYWETGFNGMTIQHEGTVSGDEMKIHVKSDGGQFPETDMTLQRAKQ
jgi:hypothetical protein